jgi:hypothetical protein
LVGWLVINEWMNKLSWQSTLHAAFPEGTYGYVGDDKTDPENIDSSSLHSLQRWMIYPTVLAYRCWRWCYLAYEIVWMNHRNG